MTPPVKTMQSKNCFEDVAYLNSLVDGLRFLDVTIAPGLSESELGELEEEYNICFPPDLSALLRHALPVRDDFPDWRGKSSAGKHVTLEKRLSWPIQHILQAVESHEFWVPSWGRRSKLLQEAMARAKELADSAPKLIPICSDCYIPSEPRQSRNPVLCFYKADIIRYGDDLAEFFWNYLMVPLPESRLAPVPCRIPFWDDVVDECKRNPMNERFICPCCGYATFDEQTPGTYEICGVCFWQDCPVQGADPTYIGGPNKVCLEEARINFKTFGASERRFIADVRPPEPDEIP